LALRDEAAMIRIIIDAAIHPDDVKQRQRMSVKS
jgi:hypothetical protein